MAIVEIPAKIKTLPYLIGVILQMNTADIPGGGGGNVLSWNPARVEDAATMSAYEGSYGPYPNSIEVDGLGYQVSADSGLAVGIAKYGDLPAAGKVWFAWTPGVAPGTAVYNASQIGITSTISTVPAADDIGVLFSSASVGLNAQLGLSVPESVDAAFAGGQQCIVILDIADGKLSVGTVAAGLAADVLTGLSYAGRKVYIGCIASFAAPGAFGGAVTTNPDDVDPALLAMIGDATPLKNLTDAPLPVGAAVGDFLVAEADGVWGGVSFKYRDKTPDGAKVVSIEPPVLVPCGATSQSGEGGESGASTSDDVGNASSVVGDTVTDALETLKAGVAGAVADAHTAELVASVASTAAAAAQADVDALEPYVVSKKVTVLVDAGGYLPGTLYLAGAAIDIDNAELLALPDGVYKFMQITDGNMVTVGGHNWVSYQTYFSGDIITIEKRGTYNDGAADHAVISITCENVKQNMSPGGVDLDLITAPGWDWLFGNNAGTFTGVTPDGLTDGYARVTTELDWVGGFGGAIRMRFRRGGPFPVATYERSYYNGAWSVWALI